MVAPTRSTAAHNNHTANASSNASSNASPSNPSKPSAMPSNNANSKDATGAPTTVDNPNRSGEPIIDPELADLPAPPHLRSASTNGAGNGSTAHLREPGGPMSITESIASAPNPRPADFSMLPISKEEIDLEALDVATEEGGIPGSPTAKLMRAIAPPNASQPDPKWPAPPPNASVNLFIGRALLSHGNDNWPLKPNDIVNWIRKHYPAEWDGDEGRCSAHRVRTYLARKGADMYYEKLNQGCIAGWRIRQNHLWRFENGGFLGRGMKQEEAIAQAHKESEAIATAAHKAAAAEALAAGHPGVKVSMSLPGINDGTPPIKRQRLKTAGQARRRNTVKTKLEDETGDLSLASAADGDSSFYDPSPAHDGYNPQSSYDTDPQHQHQQPGPSTDHHQQQSQQQSQQHHHMSDTDQGGNSSGVPIDPSLMSGQGDQMDLQMVQQAMQAAAAANAGQMDELEMGMQLPIEMQMHSGEHDDGGDGLDGRYQTSAASGGQHPYTPHGGFGYGNDGQGQVYGHTGYQGQ